MKPIFLSLLLFAFLLTCASADWIFGYGSLISKSSRDSTYPTDVWHSVRVKGIKRGWFAPGTVVAGWASLINNKEQLAPTYLGAYLDASYTTNGVIFSVNSSGLAAFDVRELSGAGYSRKTLPITSITVLDGNQLVDGDVVYFYSMDQSTAVLPTDTTPIVTSYVDTILTGCLLIDKQFSQTESNFTVEFIRTTNDWSPHWVNDRLLPRRPWVYQPQVGIIDKLLAANLGQDILGAIVMDDPTDVDDNWGTMLNDALGRINMLEADVKKLKEKSSDGERGASIFNRGALVLVMGLLLVFVSWVL